MTNLLTEDVEDADESVFGSLPLHIGLHSGWNVENHVDFPVDPREELAVHVLQQRQEVVFRLFIFRSNVKSKGKERKGKRRRMYPPSQLRSIQVKQRQIKSGQARQSKIKLESTRVKIQSKSNQSSQNHVRKNNLEARLAYTKLKPKAKRKISTYKEDNKINKKKHHRGGDINR